MTYWKQILINYFLFIFLWNFGECYSRHIQAPQALPALLLHIFTSASYWNPVSHWFCLPAVSMEEETLNGTVNRFRQNFPQKVTCSGMVWSSNWAFDIPQSNCNLKSCSRWKRMFSVAVTLLDHHLMQQIWECGIVMFKGVCSRQIVVWCLYICSRCFTDGKSGSGGNPGKKISSLVVQ